MKRDVRGAVTVAPHMRVWDRQQSVRVHADAVTLFNLLAGVELWPAIFRQIRSIRVLRRDGRRRLIQVSARWHGLPLAYRAVVTVDTKQLRFTIRHVSAFTRGSVDTWMVEPAPDAPDHPAAVDLRVDARVVVPVPIAGPLLAREAIGGRIARDLSETMLYRLKEVAEGASLAGPE